MTSHSLRVGISFSIALGAGALMLTQAPANAAPAPIVIAVEAPLTGAQASNGIDMARGVQLAVDEVNAKGGIKGRTIRLVKLDDMADPTMAADMVTAAKKAGAVAVVGPYNSSVGLLNLPLYIKAGITPVQMTSTDQTSGMGITVQPKNSQISPVEVKYITGQKVKKVAMLVDPSDYTQGMADRTRTALTSAGITVTSTPIAEGATDYTAQVKTALASSPDLVYVSTYYPEGAKIAKALTSANTTAECFMGLANVDPAFVTEAGVANAARCKFSGVPAAAQLPTAATFTKAFIKKFNTAPGVWGVFTYDSAKLLANALTRVGNTNYTPVLAQLKNTKNYKGQTGLITIEKKTGNRVNVPVFILKVDPSGTFVIA
jgi:branched-chain amino acid transport system substrate-binding protein